MLFSTLPIAVHASPIITPGGVISYIRSLVKIGLPTSSCRLLGVMVNAVASFFTIFMAILRTICGKSEKMKGKI